MKGNCSSVIEALQWEWARSAMEAIKESHNLAEDFKKASYRVIVKLIL